MTRPAHLNVSPSGPLSNVRHSSAHFVDTKDFATGSCPKPLAPLVPPSTASSNAMASTAWSLSCLLLLHLSCATNATPQVNSSTSISRNSDASPSQAYAPPATAPTATKAPAPNPSTSPSTTTPASALP